MSELQYRETRKSRVWYTLITGIYSADLEAAESRLSFLGYDVMKIADRPLERLVRGRVTADHMDEVQKAIDCADWEAGRL